MRSALLAFVFPAVLGCATGRIPNTDVPNTAENRAIVAFCERYRLAVERRDTRALLAMASPRYFEDSGTPAGDDDYGFDGLQRLLAAWTDQVQQVRYEMRYRRIAVDPQNAARIHVDFTFTGSYTLASPVVAEGAPSRDEREPVLQLDPVRGTSRDTQEREAWYRRVADNRLEIERVGSEFRILSGM